MIHLEQLRLGMVGVEFERSSPPVHERFIAVLVAWIWLGFELLVVTIRCSKRPRDEW